MIGVRHLRQLSRHFVQRLRALHPLEVEASLLNSCNLKCIYCRCSAVGLPQMSTEEWRAVIRRLAALGTLRMKFHGGEPTLRDDFRDLCAESRAAGMVTAAVTNGTIIPARPELLDHLDELVVSLDSPHRENNDRMRGAGTYQSAVATLDLARRRPKLAVYIDMVLTRLNVEDLEEMLLFCEARRVGLNAQPVVFGRGPYANMVPDLALSQEEIRGVHRRLVTWKRQRRGLIFSSLAYQKAIDWPDLSVLTHPSEGTSSCVAGTYYVRIEANGDVVPCCQYETTGFQPGNVLRHGLDAALLKVQQHSCGDCWLAYYAERMALFDLKPTALWNAVLRG